MSTGSNASSIWRVSGGDPGRRGFFPGTEKVQTPAKTFPAAGGVQASVVFDADGNAFVADMTGLVQCFSPEGKLRWKSNLKGGISATPAVHLTEPRLFAGTHLGFVFALDTADGRTVWQRRVPTRSDPRILSDLLYWTEAKGVVLSSWSENFFALEEGSGAELMSWAAGISPAAAASADAGGNLYCMRAVPRAGLELVRIKQGGQQEVLLAEKEDSRGARRALLNAAPVVDLNRSVLYAVFNRERQSVLNAWSLKAQRLLWAKTLDSPVQGTPTVAGDGSLRICDLRGRVISLNTEGKVQFTQSSDCEYLIAGGVCNGSGTFFVGDPTGAILSIGEQGSVEHISEAKRAIQGRPSFGPDGSLWVPSTDKTVYRFTT